MITREILLGSPNLEFQNLTFHFIVLLYSFTFQGNKQGM